MPSMEFAAHFNNLEGDMIVGDIEIRGNDFQEKPYSVKVPFKTKDSAEINIPLGPGNLHLWVKVVSNEMIKVGGDIKLPHPAGVAQHNFPEFDIPKSGEVIIK